MRGDLLDFYIFIIQEFPKKHKNKQRKRKYILKNKKYKKEGGDQLLMVSPPVRVGGHCWTTHSASSVDGLIRRHTTIRAVSGDRPGTVPRIVIGRHSPPLGGV